MNIQVCGPNKSFVLNDTKLLGEGAIQRRFETTVDVYQAIKRSTSYDITLLWMAGYGAAKFVSIPRRFRSPCIVIVGGGEINNKDIFCKTMKAEGAIFVSPHLLKEALKLGEIPKNIAISTPSVSPDLFTPGIKEPKTAAMAGPFLNTKRLLDKGVDRLFKYAHLHEDWSFKLFGVDYENETNLPFSEIETICGKIPKNVELIQYEPNHDKAASLWANILSKTESIICFSRIEGLPNTLLEGMMANCKPITNNDLPGVIYAIGGNYKSPRERAIKIANPVIRLYALKTVLERAL